MNRLIAIANPKGGIGKSVTSVNLSTSLALYGKKTLLVDCDPRGKATSFSGLKDSTCTWNLGDVLLGKIEPADAVVSTILERLDVLPGGFNLFYAASKLSRTPGNEKILKFFLQDFEKSYDYIIIDVPSSFSFLSVAAMAASDWLIVPIDPSPGTIDDFKILFQMINHIRNKFQVSLKIFGILFNRWGSRQNNIKFFSQKELNGLEKIVFSTRIPDDGILGAAEAACLPAAFYDIGSRGARAYLDLAGEMLPLFT